MRSIAILAATLLLASCVRLVPDVSGPSQPTTVTPPASQAQSAYLSGVVPGPSISSLSLGQGDAGTALASFRESCPKLLARTDQSGLTNRIDWQPACIEAERWSASEARRFFTTHFETARIGDGRAFATGYFEPEIRGSLTRQPGYDIPVYKMPPELTRDWPADVPESERTGRAPLGRYDASGNFVRYYERAEIMDGALAGRGLEIAWAADEIEFFFLQIQGSGLLRLPDGSLMRIGYAGQNGREYVGIGRVMRERGLIGDGTNYPTSMQGIVAWLRDNPAQADEILNLNKSWIFFRTLQTDGPLGALEVPVRREASVAADPRYVPLGAPVWLDLDRNEADGLWIAQDTGGAIKGANRFDTFWGNGADARQIAGGMSGRGEALVFLPKGTVQRLNSQ